MTFRPAQILIELTIALAVAMIAILALIQSATKSVSNSTYSQNQSQATNNITRAVEWLRNEKKYQLARFHYSCIWSQILPTYIRLEYPKSLCR